MATKKFEIMRKDYLLINQYLTKGKAGIFGLRNKRAMNAIDNAAKEDSVEIDFVLEKWNLDKSQMDAVEPIIFTALYDGPYQKGKDGVIRGLSYCTYALGFTEKEVHIFKKTWNVINRDTTIVTNEFFYDDVTSITVFDKKMSDFFTVKSKLFRKIKGSVVGERKQQIIFTVFNEEYRTPMFSNTDSYFESLQGAINLIRERKGKN